MAIDPAGFPLDLTGTNNRNLVLNDTRSITSNEDTVFVPDGGPFYTNSLVIRSGVKVLKPNVDYKCLHVLSDASRDSGLNVCAVIMITSTEVTALSMDYQVVGGKYADTVPVIRQLLENAENIERGVNWNTHVYAKPDLFEPAPHFVSGEDFSDWSKVLSGLRAIETAIFLKDVAAWNSAYQYLDNLIQNRISALDLTSFATRSGLNAEVAKLAQKTQVYTKLEADARYYTKTEVTGLIGDIDGNEMYYTETEVDAKFMPTLVADAKFATKAEMNRIDSLKVDKSVVYTRVQSDDKYPLKINVYTKDHIDDSFVIKGTSFTKAESDERYAYKTDAYTKVDSDKRYALRTQIPTAPDLSKFITRADVDSTYLKINTADVLYLRRTTADSTYAKISDLEGFKTLNDKFGNYYTRMEADERFAALIDVNNRFYTKAQSDSLFYTKTYVMATFTTKENLSNEVAGLTRSLNTKADSTWVSANHYTKADIDTRVYTKTESDTRYYTKSVIDANLVTTGALSRALAQYTTLSEFGTRTQAVNDELKARYTKNEVNELFYSRAILDAQFLRSATADAKFATIVDKNALAAELGQVKDTATADRNYANTTFAQRAQVYTKAECNAQYVSTSGVSTITGSVPYTALLALRFKNTNTGTEHCGGIGWVDANNTDIGYVHFLNHSGTGKASLVVTGRAASSSTERPIFQINDVGMWHFKYGDLESYFAKNNQSYLKADSDAKYLPKDNNSLNLTGVQAALTINRTDGNDEYGPSINFSKNNTLWGMIKAAPSTLDIYVKRGASGAPITARVTGSGFWHAAYGNLHEYFALKTEVYAKSATLSEAQMNERFLSMSNASAQYVARSEWSTENTNLTRLIQQRAETTWVNTSFYNKTDSDSRYYTKAAIDSGIYTKAQADNNFASIALLNAETSKLTPKTLLTNEINAVKALFSGYPTHEALATASNNTFTRAEAAANTQLRSYTYSKSEADARFYPIGSGQQNYTELTQARAEIAALKQQVAIVLARSEAYKVGDVYVTTNNFLNSTQVNTHHGYGTWERTSQGRTLVGYSPNGWMDGAVWDAPGSELYRYHASAKIMGASFGYFKEAIEIVNLPAHRHSDYQSGFNKFSSKASDTDTRTVTKADWGNSWEESGIASISTAKWEQATEKSIGGNAPLGITQPSLVVGMWKRVA